MATRGKTKRPHPALAKLALIVRGADTPAKDLTPESQGLEAVAEGFRRMAQAGG